MRDVIAWICVIAVFFSLAWILAGLRDTEPKTRQASAFVFLYDGQKFTDFAKIRGTYAMPPNTTADWDLVSIDPKTWTCSGIVYAMSEEDAKTATIKMYNITLANMKGENK